MTDLQLRFLPWLRRGLARSARAKAGEGFAALDVSFKVGGAPVTQTLRLRGPGDVVGISSAQVIRTEPRSGTVDFEPNYFPCIELRTPDLPWMFTPAAADGEKLLPWVTLVTVTESLAALATRADSPLPVLTVPSSELPPDLTEMWAWAHVQTTSQYARKDLTQALTDDPDAFISRIISPRNLAADTAYLACLVPTYMAGVLTGLGLPAGEDVGQSLAWEANPSARDIELPVYYSWTFKTGAAGDFEMLVERLQARELDETVGRRLLDISDMGVPLPAAKLPQPKTPATTYYFGALVSSTAIAEAPNEDRDTLREALYDVLTPTMPDVADGYDYLQDDPVITPAHYGREQLSGAPLPPPKPTKERTASGYEPVWYGDVNTHPRTRGAAGLGVRIVRRNQEAFMARAWEEVTALRAVNQTLQQATYALLISAQWQSRVTALAAGELLTVTRSAHTRILTEAGGTTIWRELERAAAPEGAVSLDMQRIIRTGGAVFHALRMVDSAAPVARVFREQVILAPERWSDIATHTLPLGAQVLEQAATDTESSGMSGWYADTLRIETERLNSTLTNILADETRPIQGANAAVLTLNQLAGGHIREMEALRRRRVPFTETMRAALTAAVSLQNATDAYMVRVEAGDIPPRSQLRVIQNQSDNFRAKVQDWSLDNTTIEPPPAGQPVTTLEPIADSLRTALNAEAAISAHLQARITLSNAVWGTRPVPSQWSAAPVFTDAVYRYVCEISSEFMLPGLGDIPNNTVGLVEVNAEHIESVLLGINHEMSREMRWREYPAELNGTWFEHFWSETQPDIVDIDSWKARAPLGANLIGAASSGSLVLLIKGDILTRYPNLIVYAVQAEVAQIGPRQKARVPGDPEVQLYPAFSGELETGVKFFGFEGMKMEDALGDGTDANAGYFFVLQEQPAEPRFGLDEVVPGADYDPAALTTWDELSWGHFMLDENADTPAYLSIVGTFAGSVSSTLSPTWGNDAGAMARIVLQRPVRLLVHASSMLPGVTS